MGGGGGGGRYKTGKGNPVLRFQQNGGCGSFSHAKGGGGTQLLFDIV